MRAMLALFGLPFVILVPLVLGSTPAPVASGALSVSGAVELTREPGTWFHIEIVNCGPVAVEIHHVACKCRTSGDGYDVAVTVAYG